MNEHSVNEKFSFFGRLIAILIEDIQMIRNVKVYLGVFLGYEFYFYVTQKRAIPFWELLSLLHTLYRIRLVVCNMDFMQRISKKRFCNFDFRQRNP